MIVPLPAAPIPELELPAITLPAPAAVPPLRLLVDVVSKIAMPPELDIPTVPLAVVPMKFPWITLALLLFEISIAAPWFPEITFRAAVVVPPIVLLDELISWIPREFRSEERRVGKEC